MKQLKHSQTMQVPAHTRSSVPRRTLFKQGTSRVQPSRTALCPNGVVKCYGMNSHTGLVRKSNEDRVNILLDITQPHFRKNEVWPNCSYFGLFDGHGGKGCSSFLSSALHNFIINSPYFPSDPKTALLNGFEAAETAFLAQYPQYTDSSGSCAIVVLVVGEMCYVANVGDSRAVLSTNRGETVVSLSKDHKADDPAERMRVEAAGGKVVFAEGCFRASPGGLAVSRAFGNFQVKRAAPGMIVPTPEIHVLAIDKSCDFIVMASDGIFDALSNDDIVQTVWSLAHSTRDLTVLSSQVAESLIRRSFYRFSTDNVTAVFIALPGLKQEINTQQ